jgi:outer membrane protein OmpA-like peptidoglycan-associated protein
MYRYFSPDGDGIEDELIADIICKDESTIEGWKIVLRQPGSQYLIFSEWSGPGDPSGRIVWDGRSTYGELVQSATDYPYTLTVTNSNGKSTVVEGIVGVDVLVTWVGNQARIQVPDLVFNSNSGGFDGLNQEALDRNHYTLSRIADILNKFSSYRIIVEGHANHTEAAVNARAREEQELQPLSEQRAAYAMNYIINMFNADRSRLSFVGAGGTRPIAAYTDYENWWKNRRAEFILIK